MARQATTKTVAKPTKTTAVAKRAPAREVPVKTARGRAAKSNVPAVVAHDVSGIPSKKGSSIVIVNEYSMAYLLDLEFDAAAKKYEMIGGVNTLDRISSGCLVLDTLHGGGWAPLGICQMVGPEGSGKTTTITHTLGEALMSGIRSGINDAENTLAHELMLNSMGKDFDPTLMGRLRYHDQNILEPYFNFLRHVMRNMPDKVWHDDVGGFVYRLDKANKTQASMLEILGKGGVKPDSKLSNRDFAIMPAEDSKPQLCAALDSWPSLITDAADDREHGASGGMSEKARKLAEMLPTITGRFRRKGVGLISANSLREKPGVTHGCMLYSTPVLLADGTTKAIGTIVNQRLPVKVMSYNEKTGKIEPKRVVNWYNNGLAEQGEYVRLVFDRSNNGPGGDKASVIVTKGHKVFTPDGLKAVAELSAGSTVLSRAASVAMSYDQRQVLLGCLLGDGTMRFSNDGLLLYMKHVDTQAGLLALKRKALAPSKPVTSATVTGRKTPCTMLTCVSDLIRRDVIPPDLFGVLKRGQRTISAETIAQLDLPALAVWYMSDGHYHVTYKGDPKTTTGSHHVKFSCERFDDATKALLAARIESLTGAKMSVHGRAIMAFNMDACVKLHTALQPYITPDMQYKIPCAPKRRVAKYKWDFKRPDNGNDSEAVRIVAVEPYDVFSRKNRTKYDIQVEGNSSYIVSGRRGMIVHNSPLYEAGGNVLRLSSVQRTWINTRVPKDESFKRDKENGSLNIEVNPLGGNDYYAFKGLTNVKNKAGQPFLKGWLRIWTSDPTGVGRGIDPVFDTWEYLKMTGQISGKRHLKFKVLLPKHAHMEPMTWMQFKMFILAEKFGARYAKALRENGFDRIPRMRAECFSQLASRKTVELMAAARMLTAVNGSDDLSDD